MAKAHKLEIQETVATSDETGAVLEQPRFEFRVTSEAGLFKNGKQYNKGDLVLLTEATAKAFMEAGDVEEK